MRVLVTGGSGFIGTRLASDLVAARHDVVIYDIRPSVHTNVRIIIGDVRDAAALSAATCNIDAVIHLAAEHRDDVKPISLYYDVNVLGMKNLVEACRTNDVRRILFTSTVAVYGLNKPHPNEASSPEPFNEYGKTKLEAEGVLNEWGSSLHNIAVTVRPCVIFGEGNRGNVYNLLRQIHLKRFPMVGSGANKKSMGYVGNISAFLTWSLTNCRNSDLINFADKPDLTTRDLVRMAREAMAYKGMPPTLPYSIALAIGNICDAMALAFHVSLPFSSIRVQKFCADTTIDTTKLASLPFRSPVTIMQALKNTIESEFLRAQS